MVLLDLVLLCFVTMVLFNGSLKLVTLVVLVYNFVVQSYLFMEFPLIVQEEVEESLLFVEE